MAENQLVDPLQPESSEVAFYLVTGYVAGFESDLGSDSQGTARPNHLPCMEAQATKPRSRTASSAQAR